MALPSIKSIAQKAVAKVMQFFNHQPPAAKQKCSKSPDKKPDNKLTIKSADKYSGPMRQHNAKLLAQAKQFTPKDGPLKSS